MQIDRTDRDKFVFKYSAIFFGILWLLLIADDVQDLFLLIALPFLAVMLTAYISVSVYRNFKQRRWRKAVSVGLAPLLAGLASYGLIANGVTPSVVRFALSKPYYSAVVVDGTEQTFLWRNIGAAMTSNGQVLLIYSPVAKPWQECQHANGTTEKPSLFATCSTSHGRHYMDVESLWNNFYFQTEIWN